MSANEYYNPQSYNPTSRPPPQQTPSPQPYYQSYNPPNHAPSFSSAPSYHSQAPPQPHDITSPISPFEAPFDDHVYPLKPPGAQRLDSQSTLGPDSRYYGPGGRQGSNTSFQDDIPLQDHPGAPGKDNSTDHVTMLPQDTILQQGRRYI